MNDKLITKVWRILMMCLVCGVVVAAMPRAAANEDTEMVKKVYKDVPESLFVCDGVTEPPKEALRDMGCSFREGASATYNAKKKTLTVVNTRKEHGYVEEILKKYQETATPALVSFLEKCKRVSGKWNKKAKVFVVLCVSKTDVVSFKDANENLAELIGDKTEYKKNVAIIGKLCKRKEVQVMMMADEDCDLKAVKKIAKGLKLRAPILTASVNDASKHEILLDTPSVAIVLDAYGNGGDSVGYLMSSCDELSEKVDSMLNENK